MTSSSTANGTAEIVTGVEYSLGSAWVRVPTAAATFGFVDDGTAEGGRDQDAQPPGPRRHHQRPDRAAGRAGGAYAAQAVALQDAPEGGTCHP